MKFNRMLMATLACLLLGGGYSRAQNVNKPDPSIWMEIGQEPDPNIALEIVYRGDLTQVSGSDCVLYMVDLNNNVLAMPGKYNGFLQKVALDDISAVYGVYNSNAYLCIKTDFINTQNWTRMSLWAKYPGQTGRYPVSYFQRTAAPQLWLTGL